MTEFIRLADIPKSLENTIDNLRARIEIKNIDSFYDFWGIVEVTKLGVEKIIPATRERIWTPQWINPFHFYVRDVPERVVRDELKKYRVGEEDCGIMITPTINQKTEYVAERANTRLAGKYGVVLPPSDFVDLLDPIVSRYLSIREAGLKAKPVLSIA